MYLNRALAICHIQVLAIKLRLYGLTSAAVLLPFLFETGTMLTLLLCIISDSCVQDNIATDASGNTVNKLFLNSEIF